MGMFKSDCRLITASGFSISIRSRCSLNLSVVKRARPLPLLNKLLFCWSRAGDAFIGVTLMAELVIDMLNLSSSAMTWQRDCLSGEVPFVGLGAREDLTERRFSI